MPKEISLCLGGGAARGIAHLGVLEFLESRKVKIKEISGTSMGSLVGACFALGFSAREIKQILDEVNWLKVFHVSFSKVGIVSIEKVEDFLRDKIFGNKQFSDCKIKLKVNATDIEKGKEIIFDSGSILDAVRSSISVPGIFEPGFLQEKILVDGGVINNIPVNILDEKDNSQIFVSNVGIPLDKKILYREYLETSLEGDFWKMSKMTFEPVAIDFFQKCFDILRASH